MRRLVFVVLGVAAGVAAALYLSAQQQLAGKEPEAEAPPPTEGDEG